MEQIMRNNGYPAASRLLNKLTLGYWLTMSSWELPGGLGDSILDFHCGGPGSIPNQGTEILTAFWYIFFTYEIPPIFFNFLFCCLGLSLYMPHVFITKTLCLKINVSSLPALIILFFLRFASFLKTFFFLKRWTLRVHGVTKSWTLLSN